MLLGRLKDVFYMPNDSKLYLCFEYCDYDLKKYMKSCQYKLSANCIKARAAPPFLARTPVHLPRLACSLLMICRPSSRPGSPSRTRC